MGWLRELFTRRQMLAEEIASCCDTIVGIAKIGKHDELGYKYLRIVDLANALRAELFQRGIVILPNDLSCSHETYEAHGSGRMITEYQVHTQFTITNGRESLIYAAFGVGRDNDGKALFIAQTGALKAFLKRLGLIFGEEDDPETTGERDIFPLTNRTGYQERAWDSATKASGKSKEQIESYLSTAFGFPVTSEKIAALPRQDFDTAMEWLLNKCDLTDQLQNSIEAIDRKAAGKVA